MTERLNDCCLGAAWLELFISRHFCWFVLDLSSVLTSFIVQVWCSHQFQSKLQAQGE
jgi:hypothetical protein